MPFGRLVELAAGYSVPKVKGVVTRVALYAGAHFMTAEEAVVFGIIDRVLTHRFA
jgi:ATP-dependent protease ClpP protease subunit